MQWELPDLAEVIPIRNRLTPHQAWPLLHMPPTGRDFVCPLSWHEVCCGRGEGFVFVVLASLFQRPACLWSDPRRLDAGRDPTQFRSAA